MDDQFHTTTVASSAGLALRWSTAAHSGLSRARANTAARMRQAWAERNDETGLDEAVTKMVWLAVGIAVAVTATAFFVSVYNDAQTNVPDPTVQLP
jgi:hypothetical protein